jgi:hypothetical protein
VVEAETMLTMVANMSFIQLESKYQNNQQNSVEMFALAESLVHPKG